MTKLSLKNVLAISFTLVGVGAVALVSALHIHTSFKENVEFISTNLSNSAEIISSQVNGHIGEVLGAIAAGTLSQSYSLQSPDKEIRRNSLRKILASHHGVRETWLVNNDGVTTDFASRFVLESPDVVSKLWRPENLGQLKVGDLYFGDIQFTDIASEPLLNMVTPITSGGEHQGGYVIASISLKYLWDLLSDIQIENHGVAYAYSQSGELIGHSDRALVFSKEIVSAGLLSVFFKNNVTTSKEVQRLNGDRAIIGFSPIKRLKIGVFVETPKNNALSTAYSRILVSLMVSVAIALAAIVVGILLARKLGRPIQTLAGATDQILNSDFNVAVNVEGTAETQKLGMAFNEMANQLSNSIDELKSQIEVREKSEEALAKSEGRFKGLFENSEVSIWNVGK